MIRHGILDYKRIVAAAPSSLMDVSAYWNFDETTGSFYDEIASLEGVPTSIVHQSGGRINYCAKYDATTDVIMVTSNSQIMMNGGTTYSVSMWVYLDVLPQTAGRNYYLCRLFDLTNTSAAFFIYMGSDGNYVGASFYNTAKTQYYVENNNAWSTGTWRHIVVVNQGDVQAIQIYINGVNNISYKSPADGLFRGTMMPGDLNMRIGNITATGTSAVDGRIDEMGIWHRALTSDEVAELYNAGSGKAYPF